MVNKAVQFKIKGMLRDLSESAFNPDYAFENLNIRVTARNNNTLLSITNELGPKILTINQEQSNIHKFIYEYLEEDNLIYILPIFDSPLEEDIFFKFDAIDSDGNNITFSNRYSKGYLSGIWMNHSKPDSPITEYYVYAKAPEENPLKYVYIDSNRELNKIWIELGFNFFIVRTTIPVIGRLVGSFNIKELEEPITFAIENGLSEVPINIPGTFIENTLKANTEENSKLSSHMYIPVLQPTGGLKGAYLGHSVLNNNVIIFTTDSSNVNPDYIYKISIDRDQLIFKTLFNGNLNFSSTHPIETLSFYENEDIQKIYWIDGINQTRVINISDRIDVNRYDNNSFDFVLNLKLQEVISIKKLISGGGLFPAGVVLYCFTYYNLYGLESNIFYSSPLNYISYADRGGSPEDKVSNSFQITIDKIDKRFDYLRIYSILRTSVDATPTVKLVVDLPINEDSDTITFTDGNITGDSVDPTILLYVGGEEVVALTFTHKDNTLFLGNLKLNKLLISLSIIDKLRETSYIYSNSKLIGNSINYKGYYGYDNKLKNNSFKMKSFKYLEWYRCGLLFQHKTGKWSEPIWILDYYNETPPGDYLSGFSGISNIVFPLVVLLVYSKYTSGEVVLELLLDGYIKARPVIVYPEYTDRESVAQGVLCPTIFNVGDRLGNTPFSLSSPFTRANIPFDKDKAEYYIQDNNGTWYKNWTDLDNFSLSGLNSKWGFWDLDTYQLQSANTGETQVINSPNKGAWAEFRHHYPIPDNIHRNAEFQLTQSPPSRPYYTGSDGKFSDELISLYVADNQEHYYVDLSILTFHSPEIEFDDNIKNMDTSSLKLRIVGMVPITANAGDIDLSISTFQENSTMRGFYEESIGTEIWSRLGFKGLMSGAFWFDDLSFYKKDTGNTQGLTTGWAVYPWHRNGSLNNCPKSTPDGSERRAMLDRKRISNLRFSHFTKYMDNPWKADDPNIDGRTGISGVGIFNSNENTMIKIPAPNLSSMGDINYYGNIDKVLFITTVGFKKSGYNIKTTGVLNADDNAHKIFAGKFGDMDGRFTDYTKGTDPVRVKYKSTPHAVLALNYYKDTTLVKLRILPTIYDTDNFLNYFAVNNANDSFAVNSFTFWDKAIKGVHLDVISTGISAGGSLTSNIAFGYLWLAELYNDSVQNRFGGLSQEAFENNLWLPAGEVVNLVKEDGTPIDNISINYSEGDTYYSRYDCLKTYSDDLLALNAVIDIVSFNCETRVNIDGRYDRNRGLKSNLTMTPTNFNLMNPVYTLKNNFFNYRAVNLDKFNINKFSNTLTWTKTKVSGAFTDAWTNITLASTLDMDGDKGEVRALKTFNNDIYAFQDRGLANIMFNSRTQISASDGIPIEIANSGKVDGKRYLSDKVGTTNKWSIVHSPNGLYFMDSINKAIYVFNGSLDNISDRLGFHSWVINNLTNIEPWEPQNFNNFVGYYDSKHKDIYFTNLNTSISYSEMIGLFTSFFDYGKTPSMFNLEDRFFSIRSQNNSTVLWAMNEGEFNNFFGEFKPFYTTIIVNPEMNLDKVFNNVEFRADRFDNFNNLILNKTMDNLKVWNEYLVGDSSLSNIIGRPANLKEKFRVWRANVPRANGSPLLRIRNPWVYLRLGLFIENYDRTVLHDMIVHYSV